MPLVFSRNGRLVQAVFTSFATDYVLRQKLGGTNLTYSYVQQLPFPSTEQVDPVRRRIDDAVDRLNAQRLDADNTAQLRTQLDALMFHVYGVARDDVDYMMETFPIVKRKDVATHGEYRTKRLILESYDRLAPLRSTDAEAQL